MWDDTKHVPQNSRCKVAVHVAVVDVRKMEWDIGRGVFKAAIGI